MRAICQDPTSHQRGQRTGSDLFDLVNQQAGLLTTDVRYQSISSCQWFGIFYIMYAHLAEFPSVPPSVLHSDLNSTTQ